MRSRRWKVSGRMRIFVGSEVRGQPRSGFESQAFRQTWCRVRGTPPGCHVRVQLPESCPVRRLSPAQVAAMA